MSGLLGKGQGRNLSNKPVSLHYVPTDVYMHSVSESDLEALAGSGDGLYLTALGASLGCFVSVVSTLMTVAITDPVNHAVFILGAWLAGFLSILFGGKVLLDRQSLSKKMKAYRSASQRMSASNNSGVTQIEANTTPVP